MKIPKALRDVGRRVPVSEVNGQDSEHGQDGMKRVLGAFALTVMGIAAIIGTGIFVLPGVAAAEHAGPAVILSFGMCGIVCSVVALCYAEFASMIRSSGSAFMYAYATLGELVAWIIGWDLLLEYAFGASGVAVGWSSYFKNVLVNVFGPGHYAQAPAGQFWTAAAVAGAGILALTGLRWLLLPAFAVAADSGKVKRACCGLLALIVNVAPYVAGILALGYIGLPDRFAHAPIAIPWMVISCAGLYIAVLLYLRSKLLPVVRESDNALVRRGGALLLNLAPVAVALVGLAGFPSFDLPAMLIVMGVSALLVRGIHHTARASTVFVVIKLVVIGVFIALGITHINPANWHPFIPARQWLVDAPGQGHWAYGWQGVLTGAAIVLFAFIGFDGVTTAASECKRPQRDVPIGVLSSLLICTVAYMVMAVVMTGDMHYSLLGGNEAIGAAPVALVLNYIGLSSLSWLISIGAIAGITSALILSLYGQSRVQWAMANRGLVSPKLGKLHPQYGTPSNAIMIWGAIAAVVAGLLPISELSELTNIGTLAAFIIVQIGIVVLRYKEPNRERAFRCPSLLAPIVTLVGRLVLRKRGFRCPWLPDLPIFGSLCCLVFMLSLPALTWYRFIGWMAIGAVVYMCYGFRHSKLAKRNADQK